MPFIDNPLGYCNLFYSYDCCGNRLLYVIQKFNIDEVVYPFHSLLFDFVSKYYVPHMYMENFDFKISLHNLYSGMTTSFVAWLVLWLEDTRCYGRFHVTWEIPLALSGAVRGVITMYIQFGLTVKWFFWTSEFFFHF